MSEFRSNLAYELGTAAADKSLDQGQPVMNYERQRLECRNEAAIAECKAKLKTRSDERELLRVQIRSSPQVVFNARLRRLYYVSIATVLMTGGVSFAHLAFAPFGFGWEAWLYAATLPLICAGLEEVVLERYGTPRIVGLVSFLGFLLGLVGLFLLAQLRGDVVAVYLKAAISDIATTGTPSDMVQFYGTAAQHLRNIFGLLATALEIATGIMIWEARRISTTPLFAAERAKDRLAVVEQEMIELVNRIVFLESEPKVFAAEFMRDFHHGLISRIERFSPSRTGQFLSILMVGVVLSQLTQGQSMTVVLPDFTRSTVIAKTSDSDSEYQKNLNATANLLNNLPPGTQFSVYGVTERSFSSPLALVTGLIPDDRGPLLFMNKIELARSRYAEQFRATASRVNVTARKTDLIGAFFIASEALRGVKGERNVVVLSDMRQSAKPLDIEAPNLISVKSALGVVEREHLIPDLHGANVWILGVDASGKDIAYVASLRQFWTAYVAKSGATLRAFSMMRDLPDLNLPEKRSK
jgi:hypothetical protein